MNRERLADNGVRRSGATRESHGKLPAIDGAATAVRLARRNGLQPHCLTRGEGTSRGARRPTGRPHEHRWRRRHGAHAAAAIPA